MNECTLSLKTNKFSFSMSFPLDCDADEVRCNLKYFLMCCGWQEKQIKEILGEDDENY